MPYVGRQHVTIKKSLRATLQPKMELFHTYNVFLRILVPKDPLNVILSSILILTSMYGCS